MDIHSLSFDTKDATLSFSESVFTPSKSVPTTSTAPSSPPPQYVASPGVVAGVVVAVFALTAAVGLLVAVRAVYQSKTRQRRRETGAQQGEDGSAPTPLIPFPDDFVEDVGDAVSAPTAICVDRLTPIRQRQLLLDQLRRQQSQHQQRYLYSLVRPSTTTTNSDTTPSHHPPYEVPQEAGYTASMSMNTTVGDPVSTRRSGHAVSTASLLPPHFQPRQQHRSPSPSPPSETIHGLPFLPLTEAGQREMDGVERLTLPELYALMPLVEVVPISHSPLLSPLSRPRPSHTTETAMESSTTAAAAASSTTLPIHHRSHESSETSVFVGSGTEAQRRHHHHRQRRPHSPRSHGSERHGQQQQPSHTRRPRSHGNREESGRAVSPTAISVSLQSNSQLQSSSVVYGAHLPYIVPPATPEKGQRDGSEKEEDAQQYSEPVFCMSSSIDGDGV